MSTDYDLVVVGAGKFTQPTLAVITHTADSSSPGWFGLAAAKVYLELHPIENILVLESSRTCGGTWAEDRIYPGLKSNNLHGTYEYPDFPMDPEVYGVRPGEHIPGDVLHRYLTDFAKRFGGFSRTRFHARVDAVEPAPNDT